MLYFTTCYSLNKDFIILLNSCAFIVLLLFITWSGDETDGIRLLFIAWIHKRMNIVTIVDNVLIYKSLPIAWVGSDSSDSYSGSSFVGKGNSVSWVINARC